MNFLSSMVKGSDQPKPTSDEPNNSAHKPASNSDLFTSAKVVADAAQAQFRNEPEKLDKNKVAGAAADLLEAGSEYGKLDGTQGVGKYVDQAENYLRQYSAPKPSADEPPAGEKKPAAEDPAPAVTADEKEAPAIAADEKSAPAIAADEKEVPAAADEKSAPAIGAGEKEAEESTESEKPSGGGAGEYLKMAEGLLNKPSAGGDGDEKPESGYGDVMKMAGGFLNK
ncbi:hypothetical protein STAS_20654 [Striga asiatica]|uniref:Nodulin-related protein 1 n=1 Tax=Striga asiatica TaxID=4170 RepID=A0A5A7QFS4_STRAF|nr:hypothetical protein STAS_20654 [Striga asiatica]